MPNIDISDVSNLLQQYSNFTTLVGQSSLTSDKLITLLADPSKKVFVPTDRSFYDAGITLPDLLNLIPPQADSIIAEHVTTNGCTSTGKKPNISDSSIVKIYQIQNQDGTNGATLKIVDKVLTDNSKSDDCNPTRLTVNLSTSSPVLPGMSLSQGVSGGGG